MICIISSDSCQYTVLVVVVLLFPLEMKMGLDIIFLNSKTHWLLFLNNKNIYSLDCPDTAVFVWILFINALPYDALINLSIWKELTICAKLWLSYYTTFSFFCKCSLCDIKYSWVHLALHRIEQHIKIVTKINEAW